MTVDPLRKILPYTTVALIIAALWVGYTFYSRHDQENRAEAKAVAEEAKADRDSIDKIGGGDLKILNFYASPPAVSRGNLVHLCYGVAFAKSVTIEPATEAVWPSLSKCVDIKPSKTTQYTLTAKDANGKEAKQTVEVTVD